MVFTQISIICIPVSDLDRAIQFYERALGMKVTDDVTFKISCPEAPPEMQGKEARWVELAPSSSTGEQYARVGLSNVPSRGGLLPGKLVDVVFFGSDDLEADYGKLKEKGYQVAKPQTMPGGLFSSLKDPDGNLLWLHQNGSDKDPKYNTLLQGQLSEPTTA